MGSNSKLLSSELTTHLTGRHNKVELYPFSFSEYAKITGTDTTSLSVKSMALRKRALHEYLLNGGFPELINEQNKHGYIETLLIELLRRYRPLYADVFYYRDKQCEVDSIVTSRGKVEQLIQVSYDISSEKTLNRETNGLIRAAKPFKCNNLLIINFDTEQEIKKKGYNIRVVPAAEWLVKQ